jgi:hypothetical protein
MTRAIRIIVSAALVTALTAALHSGAVSAQMAEPDPGERGGKATEQATDDSPGPATADSTSKVTSDATGTTPITAKPVPVKPSKRISKPFKPTEKIDAESVISFPANI